MKPAPHSTFVPKSPRTIFLVTGAAIFVAEAIVMLIFSYWPDQSILMGAILDSTLLLIFVSPVLYFFLFRPMVKYIREHQEIEETLRKNEEEQFKIMVRTSLDGFWITDLQGNFLEVNDAYCQLIGYSREELLKMRIEDIESDKRSPITFQHIKKLLDIGQDCFEASHRHKHGHNIEVEISANYSVLQQRFYCFLRDITERKKTEAQTYKRAHYDALTGLPNRALFNDRLRQALNVAKRDKSRLALMFLDLNKFKPINDTYGHDVGDLVLKKVAMHLQKCVRESDTVSRIGGDEFILLLPTIETPEDAILVADKALHAISQPFELQGHKLQFSASIGIAVYPEHGNTAKALTKHADTAMYYAKEHELKSAQLYQEK